MAAHKSEIGLIAADVGQTQVMTVARMAHHLERAVLALTRTAMTTRDEFGEVTMPGQTPQVDSVAFEVVNFELEQLAALKIGDRVILELSLERLGRTSARLDFRMLRPGDIRTCVQGNLSIVSVEPVTRRASPIPTRLRNVLLDIADEEVPPLP